MSYFADLSPSDAAIGGKARSLGRLAAAGCRVPGGFVVTDALFRALTADAPAFPAALDEAALRALDARAAALASAAFPPGFEDELLRGLRRWGASGSPDLRQFRSWTFARPESNLLPTS